MSTVKKKGQNIFIAIADEYYITKNYNFIIILTYLSMIVCIFLDEFMHSDFIDFEKINEFLNHYSSLITILLPLLLLIVPTGIKSIYAMCKKRRYILEIKFVKKVDNRQYEIAHDFIAGKVLYVVSAESMNADIIKNIDYYFHHTYLEKYAIQYNKIKEKLKKRYNAYNSKKSGDYQYPYVYIQFYFSRVLSGSI